MATSIDDYRVYLDTTLQLVQTLAIKSQDAATLVNTGLIEQYGALSVDSKDPYSWKYYRHLAGQYHETDIPMTVTSLDTLETIPFTTESLATHTATAAAYVYGTRYYQTLVQAYPEQETLILGILYPAPLSYAVESPNGAIVAYDTRLVEPQEATLLHELEQWIQRYLSRWDVRAFIHSDTLYAASQWAVLCTALVPLLLNLRLKRCKTGEAHSFHIKQYLASRGRLDRYWDYLTLEQALYLYRNIDTLRHRVGERQTLRQLIDILLSKRYIPIADYTMNQLTVFNTDFYPAYHFRKQPINGSYNMPRKDTFTLDELLLREQPLAPANANLSIEEYARIDQDFKTSISGVVQTKDLESSLIDYTDAVPHTLTDVLLHHWLYFISRDRYPVIVNFRDPVTGEQRSMNSRTAFIYLGYLTQYQFGTLGETIPAYQAERIFRWPTPTVAELVGGVDTRLLPVRELQTLMAKVPRLKVCYARSAFYQWGVQAYQTEQSYWYAISRIEDSRARAMAQWAIGQLHTDPLITLPESGQTYSAWLMEHGLPIATYTTTEVQLLIQTVFTAATGYRKDPTKSAANIQRAMLGILKQLSSYSIQTIAQVNEKPVRLIEWATIRTGASHVQVTARAQLPSGVHPQHLALQYHGRLSVETDLHPAQTVRSSKLSRITIPVKDALQLSTIVRSEQLVTLPRIQPLQYASPAPPIAVDDRTLVAYVAAHPATAH